MKEIVDALEDVVALLTESVDRNFSGDISSDEDVVALLTESVDRNDELSRWIMAQEVALLTESVDRKMYLIENKNKTRI